LAALEHEVANVTRRVTRLRRSRARGTRLRRIAGPFAAMAVAAAAWTVTGGVHAAGPEVMTVSVPFTVGSGSGLVAAVKDGADGRGLFIYGAAGEDKPAVRMVSEAAHSAGLIEVHAKAPGSGGSLRATLGSEAGLDGSLVTYDASGKKYFTFSESGLTAYTPEGKVIASFIRSDLASTVGLFNNAGTLAVQGGVLKSTRGGLMGYLRVYPENGTQDMAFIPQMLRGSKAK
jgi:hypothetical protein